jgi:ML-like domain
LQIVLTPTDIVYYIPDLDGQIRLWINSTDTKRPLACVEANLSNRHTVHQAAVSWVLTCVYQVLLCTSVAVWFQGFDVVASHLAARALAVLSSYQAVAEMGMR